MSAWQAVRATTAEAAAVANAAQAKEAATAEAQQRQRAEANEQKANAERDEVKALNEKLRSTQAELRSTLYAAHINLAQHAWAASNPERVDELLIRHRPKPGEPDIRGFEWHYLYHLSHSELLKLQGHTNRIISLAYSPDGKRLASVARGGEVKMWDVRTGQPLWTITHTRGAYGLAMAADGQRIAIATRDGVTVRDSQTGEEVRDYKHTNGASASVSFSSDGKLLASGGYKTLEENKWETEVKIWDTQSSQEVLTFKGPAESLTSVSFSLDGKRLAGVFPFDGVRIWDTGTGQELLSIKEDPVLDGTFSPDGNFVATAGRLKGSLWNAQTGQLVRSLGRDVQRVAFSRDGKRLATSSTLQGTLQISDLETGKEIRTLRGRFSAIAFSPDHSHVASPADALTIKIWDTQKPQEYRSLETGHTVASSRDWTRMAGISADNSIRIINAETGQPILRLEGHSVQVQMIAFSPDGKHLASGAGGRIGEVGIGPNTQAEVKVWDAQSGAQRFTIAGLTGNIFGLAYSSDSSRLLTVSQSPPDPATVALKVWDADNGRELLSIKGHTGPIWSALFSPDGQRLVSAGAELKVWDAKSGQESHRFERQASGWYESLGYSPDGKRLASGRSDGIVKVWDAETYQELLSFKGHTSRITSVTFSADGKRLATQANEGKAKVWDATSGQEYLTLEATIGRFNRAIFSPNGHGLAINGPNGIVRIFDATPLPEQP